MSFEPRGTELIVGPNIDDPRFDLEDWRDRAIDRIWRVMNGEWDDSVEQLLAIGGALHDRRVLDVVVFDITWSDDEQQPKFVAFWSKVCRTLRPEDATPALMVLACAAWMDNDLVLMRGAMGRMVIRRSTGEPYTVTFAHLMLLAMNMDCQRETWLRAMANVTRGDCRWGRGGLPHATY